MAATQIPPPGISPETPVNPPPKEKSVWLWIFGGCGTLLLLLVIAGFLVMRTFVKSHVHVGPNGDVDIQMPGGASMHTGDAKDIGLPIYPGVDTKNAKSVEMTMPNGQQALSMAVYTSRDPVEKVDAWYQQNVDPDFTRQGPGKKQIMLGDKTFPYPIQERDIAYTCARGNTMFVITLDAFAGITRITLMRSSTPVRQTQ
jgi:hypothetical protein